MSSRVRMRQATRIRFFGDLMHRCVYIYIYDVYDNVYIIVTYTIKIKTRCIIFHGHLRVELGRWSVEEMT